MGIRIWLFLVGTLSSSFCPTIIAHPDSQPSAHFIPITTRSNDDSKLSKRTSNLSNEPFDRSFHGREIIEISDPTTDSVLHLPHYPAIDCTNEKECSAINGDTTPMPTFRPYTQEELNGFLKKYVETNGQMPTAEQPSNKLANIYMDETVNVLDEDTGKSNEKSKSWQLMQAQSHKHPQDDRTGWVTLEPVPWSASQISKWEPNKKPSGVPQWNEDPPQAPWNRPQSNRWPEKPWNNKNTYEYKPSKPYSDKYNTRPANYDNWGAGSDIITDEGPSFPHEPARPTWYERPQTEVVYHSEKEQYGHPSTHPAEGDGRWVLLSSTKGYSVPHRSRAQQRSLFVTGTNKDSPSVKSHRSVKLTVLPPLNGTTNTTTIHDGMVEVEQTQQTVEEAHREHVAKMMKLDNKLSQPSTLSQPIRLPTKRNGASIKVYPIHSPQSQARNNAMLAAVGAGMIPATVAMMLPMVLGRRRRRSAESDHFDHLPLPQLWQ